jgi:acyl-CoA synthetase (AMP-forming)/AMP-acid ligase II
MAEPTAHIDTFIRDSLPPRALWPEMDYSVLPELAAYPARMNAATELLDRTVAYGGGARPAIYFGADIWSYADLLATANRIARVLVEDHGMAPGERVLLRSGNHPMQIAAWFAVLKAGGIAISTMPVLRERELVYMIGKAKIQLAICDRKARKQSRRTCAPFCISEWTARNRWKAAWRTSRPRSRPSTPPPTIPPSSALPRAPPARPRAPSISIATSSPSPTPSSAMW